MIRRLPLLLALLATAPALAQDDGAASAGTAGAGPTQDTPEASETVAAVERDNTRDPAQVEAYKAVKQRFAERTAEFEDDVRRYLQVQRRDELAKVSDGYDALVQTLEERERAQRDLAIKRLEEFLLRYPDVPDTDNIRFRLAELYYEKAIEDWLEAQAGFSDKEEEYDRKYDEAVKALEAGDPTLFEQLEELETPMKDLGRSIELYGAIISRNEPLPPEERWENLDRAYYSLGFAYMDTQSKQHDYLQARKAFQELLRVAGEESDLADAAHMFLGKLLFEEEKRFEDALAEYAAVVEKGPKGDYYDDAMFQLAWTYYKLAGTNPDYEPRALELFAKILDDSEIEMQESGTESAYAPDARLNMARTLADVADRLPFDDERTAIDIADAFFAEVGQRPWERDVYIALAEVLAGCIPVPDACPPGEQNFGMFRVDWAIDVYERLQTDPRWVKEPDNPAFQMKKIWLLRHKDVPNLDEDLPREQALFVDRYGETTRDAYTGEEKPNPWWVANRNNPEALDLVRQAVEKSLSQVAIGIMKQAQQENDPGLYRSAADKFREYLDNFPIADNFFENQWYLANALLKAEPRDAGQPWGPHAEALREYRSLVQSRDNHPYGDGALFGVMSARQNILLAQGKPLDQLPADAEVEEVYTTDQGKEITRYKLSDDHVALIDSMDLILGHEFTEPAKEGIPDYREALASNRDFLMYTPALIYRQHNHLDKARERAEVLLAAGAEDLDYRCNTEEVSFAANIIAQTYEQEGDLEAYSAATKRFRQYFDQCGAKKESWEKLGEQVDFIICQNKKDGGDRLAAAQCFEGWFEERDCEDRANRENEKCRFALYNAANSYDIVGRAEQANDMFERYVSLYPKDDLSLPLFMRIANNYESTFDLDQAISYYERLVANDPRREYAGTADAMYNAAFLKVGIGDHRGAAEGYERYARVNSELADAEDVMFRAGEQWEEVSDREALRFYDRYLRTYGPGKPGSNPSHVVEVKYRIAQLREGNRRAYERAMDEMQQTFDDYLEQGVALSPKANRLAAEWAFDKLQDAYATLTDDQLSGDQDRDNAMLEEKDAEEIPAFETEARELIRKYKDFEYGTGAFYYLGAAKLYIAELIYAMDCPFDDMETCDVWWELYEENWRPLAVEFEDVARKRFQALIQQGKEAKMHSEWIDRAYETLNKLDPFNFPDVKSEARGGTDLEGLPRVRPLDIPDPSDPSAERPGETGGVDAPPAPEGDVPSAPDGAPDEAPVPEPAGAPEPAGTPPAETTPSEGGDSPWGNR